MRQEYSKQCTYGMQKMHIFIFSPNECSLSAHNVYTMELEVSGPFGANMISSSKGQVVLTASNAFKEMLEVVDEGQYQILDGQSVSSSKIQINIVADEITYYRSFSQYALVFSHCFFQMRDLFSSIESAGNWRVLRQESILPAKVLNSSFRTC